MNPWRCMGVPNNGLLSRARTLCTGLFRTVVFAIQFDMYEEIPYIVSPTNETMTKRAFFTVNSQVVAKIVGT